MVGFDDPEYDEDGKPVSDKGAEQAFAEMFFYADKLRDRARREPGDDLATALLAAELDGERLSDPDFNFFFLLLLIAGNETTRTVTTNGMLALVEHPAELARAACRSGAADRRDRGDPALRAGGALLPPPVDRRRRDPRRSASSPIRS